MRIIVIGAGEVGFSIAEKLVKENADVILIDNDLQRLNEISEVLDVYTIHGSGANPQTLQKAQLDLAELIIAATNVDEVNILACKIAQIMSPSSQRIARIHDLEYIEVLGEETLKQAMGINFIINPVQEAVDHIIDFLESLGAVDVIDISNNKLRLIGVKASNTPHIIGEKLKTNFNLSDNNMLIAAIYRNNDLIIPNANTVITKDDIIYVASTPEHIKEVKKFFNLETSNSITVIGGGAVGYNLAKRLENEGYTKIKLVENNQERCEFLSQNLQTTIVLKGDGTDQALLNEENLAQADTFIALTTDDEKNMISCLMAKKMGVQHTITRVNKFSYANLVSAIGLESLVSLRVAAISGILKYIRRGRVVSVHTLKTEDAEILEIQVMPSAPILGLKLEEAPFPDGSLILAIIRNEEILIPDKNTIIEVKDTLIIISKTKAIKKIENLLTVKFSFF